MMIMGHSKYELNTVKNHVELYLSYNTPYNSQ